jgi:hypothetical protein
MIPEAWRRARTSEIASWCRSLKDCETHPLIKFVDVATTMAQVEDRAYVYVL